MKATTERSTMDTGLRNGCGTRKVALLALVTASILAGCGGGGGSDAAVTTTAAKLPSGCTEAPFDISLGAGAGTKPSSFEVADAAARRISVLPGKMAFDASEMAGLTSQAGVTPLGAYTIYLTDGGIPQDELRGSGEGTVADGSATVAAVRILPAAEGGLVEGEVVAPTSSLEYETRSETPAVSAAIVPEGDTAEMALTDEVTGTVTVLQVGDDSLCVDLDLTIAGDQGGALEGNVLAPVVRAGDSFFIT